MKNFALESYNNQMTSNLKNEIIVLKMDLPLSP